MAAVVRPWVPRDIVAFYLGVQAFGEENLIAVRNSNLYGNPRLADRTVEALQDKLNRDRDLFDGPVPDDWDQPVPYSRWVCDEVSALYADVLQHNGVCDLIKGNERYNRFLLARSVSSMRLKLWSDRRSLWFSFLRQQYDDHHFHLAQQDGPQQQVPQQDGPQQQVPQQVPQQDGPQQQVPQQVPQQAPQQDGPQQVPQQEVPQPNFVQMFQQINNNIENGFAAMNQRIHTLEQRIDTALNNL